MITPKQLLAVADRIAPVDTALEGDPCGIMLDLDNPTDRVLVALDVTCDVLDEAVRMGCGIIVTHHPLIYHPLRRLGVGDRVCTAIRAGLSVLSFHTCWDAADGGVNDQLAGRLGLTGVRRFGELGRIGALPQPLDAAGLARLAMERLGARHAGVVDGGRLIRTVAVCGGAGSGETDFLVSAGADAFVTGELPHHALLELRGCGISAAVLGHYETEALAGDELARRLEELLGGRACVLRSRCEKAPDFHLFAE